jgi:hypothetical protein
VRNAKDEGLGGVEKKEDLPNAKEEMRNKRVVGPVDGAPVESIPVEEHAACDAV